MEIHEKVECYTGTDDSLQFDHSKIIFKGPGGDFYYAKTNKRCFLPKGVELDIDSLKIKKISPGIWPLVALNHTRAPLPLPSTYYSKQPSLIDYEEASDNSDYKLQILAEVEACEILRAHPHPNIVRYQGCVVRDGRIRELCFDRYSVTLKQLLEDKMPFDKSSCLRGIKAGVAHMHQLGLVHNDLKPSNIMMDGDRPVIIDFDCCKPVGEKRGAKGGSDGWTLSFEYARVENDLYSIEKIKEALL